MSPLSCDCQNLCWLVFILDWRVVSNQGSSQRLWIAPQTVLASMTISLFHSGTAWWSRHTEWRWKSRVGTDRFGRDFGETVVTASRERREGETVVKSFQGARLDLCTRNHRRRLLKCSKGQISQKSICMQRYILANSTSLTKIKRTSSAEVSPATINI